MGFLFPGGSKANIRQRVSLPGVVSFCVMFDVFARLREETGARGRASGHGKDEGRGLAAAPHPSHVAHGPLPSPALRARGTEVKKRKNV